MRIPSAAGYIACLKDVLTSNSNQGRLYVILHRLRRTRPTPFFANETLKSRQYQNISSGGQKEETWCKGGSSSGAPSYHMKPASAKAKGRRLQQQVANAVRESFPELQSDDVRSTSMGAPGVDVQLSPRAQEVFPYAVECKACERLNLHTAWEQCVRNRGALMPLLVLRKNRSEALAVVPFDHFLTLVPNVPNVSMDYNNTYVKHSLPRSPNESVESVDPSTDPLLQQLETALGQANQALQALKESNQRKVAPLGTVD